MVNTAIVSIWKKIVGAVYWDDNTQLGYFEYDVLLLRLHRQGQEQI